jgi:hypothetical protein
LPKSLPYPLPRTLAAAAGFLQILVDFDCVLRHQLAGRVRWTMGRSTRGCPQSRERRAFLVHGDHQQPSSPRYALMASQSRLSISLSRLSSSLPS